MHLFWDHRIFKKSNNIFLDGSNLHSSQKVTDLQDDMLDAFIVYLKGRLNLELLKYSSGPRDVVFIGHSTHLPIPIGF